MVTQFFIMTKSPFNPSNVRWLKSQPYTLNLQKEQIDKEKGIIHDVVMCEAGPAKGHGVHLEQEFIEALVAYDNEHFSETGLKARFGHPSMSDTTMGTQMGVFKNFRVRDSQAIADLHVLESANLSPTKPGMKDWIFSMAEERPDFVMMSIVFKDDGYYQYDEEGEKVTPEFDDKDVFVNFGEHFYTDAVEQGAATDSLFSADFNKDKFAVQAVEFLQKHVEIHEFLKANPEKLTEFAEKAGISLSNAEPIPTEKFKGLKEWLFGASEKVEPTPEIDLSQYIPIEEHGSAIAEYDAQIEELNEQINRMTATEAEQIEELTSRDNRIKELEDKHLAQVTAIPLESAAPVTDKAAYLMDSNTQKAISLQQNKK